MQQLNLHAEAAAKRGRGRPRGSFKDKKTKDKKIEVMPKPAGAAPPLLKPELKPLTYAEVEEMTAMEQARQVFDGQHWMATIAGLVLGSFVPLASYTLIHWETAARRELWLLVAGGLIYSALTVYKWARQAFHYPLKAFGFVVLLEGVMTCSRIRWLGLAGLAILMTVNGISAAISLQAVAERE